jgi:hypothetical protein
MGKHKDDELPNAPINKNVDPTTSSGQRDAQNSRSCAFAQSTHEF